MSLAVRPYLFVQCKAALQRRARAVRARAPIAPCGGELPPGLDGIGRTLVAWAGVCARATEAYRDRGGNDARGARKWHGRVLVWGMCVAKGWGGVGTPFGVSEIAQAARGQPARWNRYVFDLALT